MILYLAFVGMFSIPSAFAEVEMVGVDIFCDENSLFGFVGMIPFLEICPITGISPIDTDRDGLLDSEEDANGNGVFEPLLGETDPNNPDTDGDALLDGWEVRGLNGDKTIPSVGDTPDLDLHALGANPLHDDVFVEVDFMDGFEPDDSSLHKVIIAFANAPVSNEDEIDGITLHIQKDEQIPFGSFWTFQENNWPEFENAKKQFNGTSLERMHPNAESILKARSLAYHYSIFINTINPIPDGPATGYGEIFGNDFVVSLGLLHSDTKLQANTFMHELGHNLSLDHGGPTVDVSTGFSISGSDINCKPNYLSVMSYSHQNPYWLKAFSSFVVEPNPLDYSRSKLPLLLENTLTESNGIGQSEPSGLHALVGPIFSQSVELTGVPIDWNGDGDTNDITSRDINTIFPSCLEFVSGQQLAGNDDWDNLRFNFIDSDHFAAGVHLGPSSELSTVDIKLVKDMVNNLNATKDSFLTQGNAKQNEGINPTLQMKSSDKYRPVLYFDQTKIEIAASGETLDSATLRLYIIDNSDNWGSVGNNIYVHRILEDWDEGNGWNTGNTVSGSGNGVTWNCSVDYDVSNNQNDCTVLWNGGSFTATPTDSVLITNGMTNQFIEFDVTSDVQSFIDGTESNFGWIIKKGDGSLNGSISFASIESQNNIPQLILSFD